MVLCFVIVNWFSFPNFVVSISAVGRMTYLWSLNLESLQQNFYGVLN